VSRSGFGGRCEVSKLLFHREQTETRGKSRCSVVCPVERPHSTKEVERYLGCAEDSPTSDDEHLMIMFYDRSDC
jgi:hypothetical protein